MGFRLSGCVNLLHTHLQSQISLNILPQWLEKWAHPLPHLYLCGALEQGYLTLAALRSFQMCNRVNSEDLPQGQSVHVDRNVISFKFYCGKHLTLIIKHYHTVLVQSWCGLDIQSSKWGIIRSMSLMVYSMSVQRQLLLLKAPQAETEGFPWCWTRAVAFMFYTMRKSAWLIHD